MPFGVSASDDTKPANDFLLADVPDPTDFLPAAEAPGLRSIDGAFRCTICGELFDGPVTLPCGHCFCSGCIRPAMSHKQECPICRKVANEGHLRPNPIVEEIINGWKDARPYILSLVKQEARRKVADQPEVHASPAKKRKRSQERSSSELGSVPGLPHTPIKPRSFKKMSHSPSKPNPVKYPSDGGAGPSRIPTSDGDEEDLPSTLGLNPKSDDLVKCPLCEKRVRYKNLNGHMDRSCKDPAPVSSSSQWSKIMAPKGNARGKQKKKSSETDEDFPLPKASYATLKDKQLKEMLQEHDLPITGDRPQWEQRHQRWVMMYNANLDRSLANRKTKNELRRDVKKWEEEMSRKKKPVVEDLVKYQQTHKPEFDRLLKLAKSTRDKSALEPNAAPSSSDDNHKPVSTDASLVGPPSSMTGVDDVIDLNSDKE